MGYNHFIDDVSITLIDKTDGCNPTKRKTFYMHTFKALAPYKINIENGIKIVRQYLLERDFSLNQTMY